jgi:hypothetical protein
MTVEDLKIIFDWVAVILLFMTFASGVGVLITGNIINKRQEQQLRTFNSGLTAAKTELGKQQERAANADARVAGLEVDAADAKAEMAKQQTRAATAERRLLELQERIKPRHLSEPDKELLVKELSPLPPITVQIAWSLTAPDGEGLAEDFADVFKRLGWKMPHNPSSNVFNVAPVGVHIVVHDRQTAPAHAGAFQHALKSIGIEAPGGVSSDVPPNSFEIRIGNKKD